MSLGTSSGRGSSGLVREIASGVEVAVVGATALELAVVVHALSGGRSAHPWGRTWWSGALPAGDREVRAVVIESGVGMVNTAHALTSLFETARPRLMIEAGAAGAYPGSGAAVGDLVLATCEVYGELGVGAPEGWLPAETFPGPIVAAPRMGGNVLPLDAGLAAAAVDLIEAAPAAPARRVVSGTFVTVSEVTGTLVAAERLERRWHALAESMEGAAAAHVCALYDVPFLQVRGVSNLVVDRDPASWDIEGAAAASCRAALLLCAHVDELVAAADSARAEAGPGSGAGAGA